SPAVRRMAREMDVDLGTIQGSGERGRVLRTDLLEIKPSPAAAALRMPMTRTHSLEERVPFIGIRRKIADHLSESAFTAVHFTHVDECDFSEVMKLREEANSFSQKMGMNVKVSYLPFFIKA